MRRNAVLCRTLFFWLDLILYALFYVDIAEALHEVYLVAKAELFVHILSFLCDCHGRWLGSRLGQLFMFLTLYLFIVRYGAVLKTYGAGIVGFGCCLLGGQTVDLDMPLAAMGRLSGERARRVRLSFWMRPLAFRGGH